jgi:inner membrane protein
MPSPLGHALAGAAVGLLAESRPLAPLAASRSRPWLLPVVAAGIAVAPDLDLVFEHFSIHLHRSGSHSVAATVLIFIVTMAVTGKVTPDGRWRWAMTLALAHLSHVGMDWLGEDPSVPHGLQALWPFSREFYVSGLDLFPSTDRRLRTSPTAWETNVWALFVESALMVPLAFLALWRRRQTSRTEV